VARQRNVRETQGSLVTHKKERMSASGAPPNDVYQRRLVVGARAVTGYLDELRLQARWAQHTGPASSQRRETGIASVRSAARKLRRNTLEA
jgi:hypothetical protein